MLGLFKKKLTANSHGHSKAVLQYLIGDNENKKALLTDESKFNYLAPTGCNDSAMMVVWPTYLIYTIDLNTPVLENEVFIFNYLRNKCTSGDLDLIRFSKH